MSDARRFECRFGIGDPDGKHSGTWKIWAGKKNSDVYVFFRPVGTWLKVSIHESGFRYWGMTAEFFRENYPDSPRSERMFDRWQGGVEVSPSLFLELRLRFPASELSTWKVPDTDQKGVLWVPSAEDGKQVEVLLLIGPSGATGWPGRKAMKTKLLAEGTLAYGRRVWIVHHVTTVPTWSNQDEAVKQIKAAALASGLTIDSVQPEHRLSVFGTDDRDGGRGFTEVSLSSVLLE